MQKIILVYFIILVLFSFKFVSAILFQKILQMNLDTIDNKLLALLQENSKKTNKELSVKLGLSITAVYERIRKLERAGVISKYVALVKPEKVERSFTAFCQIKLVQHTKGNVTRFEAQVAQLSEVLEVFHVSGEYDYILKVLVKDMESYRNFMLNKLTALDHIGSTQSTFVISPVKNTTALSIE